jgi:hypothetical protein
MDKPDRIARQQICDAIQTPTCDPLNVTPLASGNTGAGHSAVAYPEMRIAPDAPRQVRTVGAGYV